MLSAMGKVPSTWISSTGSLTMSFGPWGCTELGFNTQDDEDDVWPSCRLDFDSASLSLLGSRTTSARSQCRKSEVGKPQLLSRTRGSGAHGKQTSVCVDTCVYVSLSLYLFLCRCPCLPFPRASSCADVLRPCGCPCWVKLALRIRSGACCSVDSLVLVRFALVNSTSYERCSAHLPQEERARAVKARPRFQPMMEIDNPRAGRSASMHRHIILTLFTSFALPATHRCVM